MNRNEYKPLKTYLTNLQENTAYDEYRSKDFNFLIPLLLIKYPTIHIRDNLHVDGTFAVAFPLDSEWTLRNAIDFYESLSEVLTDTTYRLVKKTGYVDYEVDEGNIALSGMWFLLS